MDIYELLESWGIGYDKYEHPPVFTVEEAEKYDRGIEGGKTKNLFLTNKDRTKYYLVIMEADKRLEMKKLGEKMGERKLSFASEEKLEEVLGLKPGAVSPLGLINDHERAVEVWGDKSLLQYEKLGFHPNVNTATLVIDRQALIKFIELSGHEVKWF